MAYYPAGGGTYALNSSISSTATSITLTSFLEPVSSIPYTMALLNTDIAYATIAPRTSNSEFISFSGITQNADGTATLTGVVRGLAKKYPYTTSSTFQLPHSGQSVFILSDAPQVFVKYAAIENNNSFTGINAFTQSPTVPTPTNNTDAANKAWVLTVVNGGPVTTSQLIVSGTAGETLVAGNLVYFKAADARWWKCDADTAATVNEVQLGIAQGAGSAAGAITDGVLIRGVDANQSGGLAGAIGYASNTAGGIGTSAGTVEKAVGNFITASTFAFDPVYYYTPTSAIKAATAGGSTFGTPSSTNKFITQDYNSSATGLPVMRVYTGSDTWTKPAGLKYVMVEVVGGGGGGGGGTTVSVGSGGGGGGGYSREILAVAALGATEAVTVGAAGTAGAGTGGTGGTGGTSSFGTAPFLQATGGVGGEEAEQGGAGGAGSNGTLNIEGSDGQMGQIVPSGNACGGNGGDSHYGGGGKGGGPIVGSFPALAGNNYGGGGGGGGGDGNDAAGGAGKAGVVIVTEFYS